MPQQDTPPKLGVPLYLKFVSATAGTNFTILQGGALMEFHTHPPAEVLVIGSAPAGMQAALATCRTNALEGEMASSW